MRLNYHSSTMKPTSLTLSDYQDMVIMFHEESERGAAVLAGSYLESFLGNYLESKMVDRSLSKQIFGSNGVLNSFSQRIDFAQAFGYLHPVTCSQLNLIRKIRNHFAHHPKSASFAAAPASDWVRELVDLAKDNKGGSLFTPETDRRGVYLLTIGMIVLSLQH